MRADDGDPEQWDAHHWQDINPVHTEALLHLTCGGPQIIYHAGLLHVRLRYFDATARCSGLPPDVAALVHALDAESATVTLVNTNPLYERRLIIQAGAFSEHAFLAATDLANHTTTPIDNTHLRLVLPPACSLELRLTMRRYVNTPSYRQPGWM